MLGTAFSALQCQEWFLKFLSVDVLLCMMSNFLEYQTFMYFYPQYDIFDSVTQISAIVEVNSDCIC